MLTLSLALLVVVALAGSFLAVAFLRTDGSPPRFLFAAAHGLGGIVGTLLLVLALGGPPRGIETGMQNFGVIAAVCLAIALLGGGGIFARRRARRRPPGIVVGAHAILAVTGVVFLIAYRLAG